MLAAATLCSAGPGAFAADTPSGPDASADARIRPGFLHFQATELFLEIEGSYEQRRVRSSRPGRVDSVQRNRDWRFGEALSLRLDGDVIDPNLFAWQAQLKLGLSQERFHETLDWYRHTDSDTGLLLEYDVSADLFRTKPLTIHAYARRSRDRLPRRFLPSLLDERDEAGVSALLTLGSWTSELSFEWADTDRTGNRSDLDDERLTTSRLTLDNRWDISEGHRLRVAFDHQREQSEYQGSRYRFDTRRDQLRVEHELQFGDRKQHAFDTLIRSDNEQGDLARDETEVTPRLTLRHSDALRTTYRYTFHRTEQDSIEVRRHQGDFGILYKPDDRLRLSGDGYLLREIIEDDVETHEFGGTVDGVYRRPAGPGVFSANLAVSADQSRTMGSAGDRIVRGEAHALDSARPVFLSHAYVRLETLRAYNVDRTRVYIAGQDYTVLRMGRRTAVYRRLSGRIAANDQVVFDYRYEVPTDSRLNSYRVDARFEYELEGGLTPYYYHEIRRQQGDGSAGRPVFEDNTERHRLGLRYAQPRWSVNGEVESFDDSVEPYNAYQLGGQVSLFQTAAHSMDANIQSALYRFDGPDDLRQAAWIDFDVTNTFELDAYWSATLGTSYRFERDSIDGDTNAVDLEWGFHFQRGRMGLDLTAEYDLLRLADNRDEGFGVWVNIRRDLSHLLASDTERGR